MDAFFASVEQRDHPEWKGKPVIVGGDPHKRGVVSTASYEARKFGVHSAMPSREAYRLCPHGIFVPGDHKHYNEVSNQIFSIFYNYTPYVQGLSCDEAFLYIKESIPLFGSATNIAKSIKRDIKEKLNLTASVGIAPNMFLAKIASDMNKPDGLTRVPCDKGEIIKFLAPLSINRIFGVGKTLSQLLNKYGIYYIKDIQSLSLHTLSSIVGVNTAEQLISLANGEDDRNLVLESEEKSISREYTFLEDEINRDTLHDILLSLVSDVGHQLRKANKFASVGKIKLRDSSFKTITRQQAFSTAICDDFSLRELASSLFEKNYNGERIRLIGFGVSNLKNSSEHQSLLFGTPDELKEKRENLSKAIDLIKDKNEGVNISLGVPPETL